MTGLAYWLVKSEPESFSWANQVEHGVEPWTGVRNHQARKNIESMRRGDLAFFYHSNTGREIVGVVEVVSEAYPDPSASAGNWICVDMRAVGPMPKPIPLSKIKGSPEFGDFALVRQSRLSVVPVSPAHWRRLCEIGGWRE